MVIGKKHHNTLIVISLLLVWIIVKQVYSPGGLLATFFPSLSWGLIILAVGRFSGGVKSMIRRPNMKLVKWAFVIAVFQVFLMLDAGLVTKFAKSPASLTAVGVSMNLLRVGSGLMGVEFSRAFLLKRFRRWDAKLSLGVITLFYTFVENSVTGLLNLENKYQYTKTLGEIYMPSFAENLLVSYLSMMGGPLPPLVYRAPYQVFQWVSPVLPELPWGYKTLLGVMVPTLGYVAVSTCLDHRDFFKAGIRVRRRPRERGSGNESYKSTLVLSVLLVLIVWSSTGLLGFLPKVVASGSMQPILDVGDIAISVDIDPKKVRVGDIIQYEASGVSMLHRVVRRYREDGVDYLVTKGDANDSPDTPIVFQQVKGRYVMKVPKIGWTTIYLKTLLVSAMGYFSGHSRRFQLLWSLPVFIVIWFAQLKRK